MRNRLSSEEVSKSGVGRGLLDVWIARVGGARSGSALGGTNRCAHWLSPVRSQNPGELVSRWRCQRR
jgi:hypothetical protein